MDEAVKFALGEEVWVSDKRLPEVTLATYVRYEAPRTSGAWVSPCHLVDLSFKPKLTNYIWVHPSDLRHRYVCSKCDKWRMKDDYLCSACRKRLLYYRSGEVP